MAFNWAGAAAGMDEGLTEQIKLQMEREKLANDAAYRNAQLENNRINAESLKDSRAAAAEERALRTGDRKKAEERRAQFGTWAGGILQRGQPGEDATWQDHLNWARATNYQATGEDLPDSTISQVIASYQRKPVEKAKYTPMTPEEKADYEYKERTSHKFDRPPAAPRGDDWDEVKYGPKQFPTAVQNYVATLANRHPTEESAVQELLANSAGVLNGNRHLDIQTAVNALRAMYRAKGTAKDQMNRAVGAALAKSGQIKGEGQ